MESGAGVGRGVGDWTGATGAGVGRLVTGGDVGDAGPTRSISKAKVPSSAKLRTQMRQR